ncbi:hypothetical protein F2Q69_00009793 [Brassica cretica]|uniref:Uncharacterized protein n=1 Tax=Brassica cretica TaxID=69181 RepID=A0A8S9NXB3_BRACR|nr:hypothetical protein F2Q69_00009793 [Brassica cretica]
MSPILGRIARTDLGARRHTSKLDDAMVKLSQLMEARRVRDLEGLNKMKRASWTKCLAARRCNQEAQPARRSSVGAQVECVSSLSWMDYLTQLGQLGISSTQLD